MSPHPLFFVGEVVNTEFYPDQISAKQANAKWTALKTPVVV